MLIPRKLLSIAALSAVAGSSCIYQRETVREPRLRIAGSNGEWVIWSPLGDLKHEWQKPLAW